MRSLPGASTRRTAGRTGGLSCWRKLAVNMEGMLKEQERQGERLDKLEKKPAENWNATTKAILTAVVSTLAAGLTGALAAIFIK